MQVAESQGVLSSSDEVHISSSPSSTKSRRNAGKTAKGKDQGKSQGKRRQESLPQVTA